MDAFERILVRHPIVTHVGISSGDRTDQGIDTTDNGSLMLKSTAPPFPVAARGVGRRVHHLDPQPPGGHGREHCLFAYRIMSIMVPVPSLTPGWDQQGLWWGELGYNGRSRVTVDDVKPYLYLINNVIFVVSFRDGEDGGAKAAVPLRWSKKNASLWCCRIGVVVGSRSIVMKSGVRSNGPCIREQLVVRVFP
jgi:hypothetical protein